MDSKHRIKTIISYIILLLCIPAAIIIGDAVFHSEKYAFISLAVALFSCAALLLSFESREQSTPKLIVIAVLTALSVAGRVLFGFIPGFKPVTAIVVLTAVYFGAEAGFINGALTALISNFYFGQGYWTPAQMLVWGLIGFIAGIFAKALKRSMPVILCFGVICGVLFSVIMDIWTVIWIDGYFNFSRYGAILISSLSSTVAYAVSNVVFLLILSVPVGRILERIKTKYGI